MASEIFGIAGLMFALTVVGIALGYGIIKVTGAND